MSHYRVGMLACLVTLLAGLGWGQAAVADTSERDRLEKTIRQAKRKLLRIDQSISALEAKISAAKAEIQRRAEIFEKSGKKKDRKALLKARARYQELVQALERARAGRAQILARIEFLMAKLRALGPAPRLGPMAPRLVASLIF